jgi:hypothetical protein
MFLGKLADMAARQKIDLAKVANLILSFSSMKAKVRMFYARFANPEHTKIVFEETIMK